VKREKLAKTQLSKWNSKKLLGKKRR